MVSDTTPVAVSITDTVLSGAPPVSPVKPRPLLATYACLPSGVIAIPDGLGPDGDRGRHRTGRGRDHRHGAVVLVADVDVLAVRGDGHDPERALPTGMVADTTAVAVSITDTVPST